MIRAVLFDVDFTLIQPGPMFRAEGYHAFCARYGIAVDPARFDAAVAGAASILDGPEDLPYDAEIFVQYTRHIIESMGGNGAHLDACARALYAEWASNRHFHDVEGAVRAGLRGVFLHRRSGLPPRVDELAVLGVPTIRTLDELPAAIARIQHSQF
jgi:FMN phosphatase YigB (HAD superfamily)